MGDILPPMGNGNNNNNNGQNPQMGGGPLNGNSSHSNNFDAVEDALGGIDADMQIDPFDMNPVPFEDVFNVTGAEANMKKKELITNLNHLDFFGNGLGGNC